MKDNDPIAIIGAGPVGLAAAAQLNDRGIAFIIFEAGIRVASNIRDWQHVPMFSPWKYNLDKVSVQLLKKYDWIAPNQNTIPTGKDFITDYIEPLSQTLEIGPFIKFNHEVKSISRKRISKLRDFGRDLAPFMVRALTSSGIISYEVSAVIDASGTWNSPKPAGADGLPAINEDNFQEQIHYGIPDVLGTAKHRYSGKTTVVIGGGHSAINSLLELADLKKNTGYGKICWILTKASVEDAYGGLHNDELPGRGKVGLRVKEFVESGDVQVFAPFFVERFRSEVKGSVQIIGQSQNGTQSIIANEVIVATGLKPNLEMLREVRIAVDERMESPVNLAPLIDPNVHSCGSVRPHGEAELQHPEKNFYIVGIKSYGRAPTFLLATGYEQVRSVVAGIAGDWDSARQVQLKLPETGVCDVPISVDPNNLNTNETESYQISCC